MRSRPYLVFFFAPVLAYLVVLFLVAVFVAKPPALGWIGFGVAAVVGIAVAGVASLLYPRSRTNADRLHPHPGGVFRLLVVADVHCDGPALCDAVQHSIAGRPSDVLVVAPVLASPLHFLTNAESGERTDADLRLSEAVEGLSGLGITARGMLGSDDPLQAIGDALAGFPADEILLAAAASTSRNWLEFGLERRARDAFGVHVSSVTVADEAPAAPSQPR